MLQFVIILYILANISILWAIKKAQNRCKYNTIYCRDTRASMGMFTYKTDVEATRFSLNSPESKF